MKKVNVTMMKQLSLCFSLVTIILSANACSATVTISATLADSNEVIEWADPNEPNVFPEIMAGTDMTLTLISDQSGHWLGGGIYIAMPYWEIGELFGRDLNPMSQHYEGSIAENAGSDAWATQAYAQVYGDWAAGFEFKGSDDATSGPWFIIDFNSYNPGDCYVDLFDLSVTFTHPAISAFFPFVPTRDFNQDRVVSIPDFALFSQQWKQDIDNSNFSSDIDLVDDSHIDYLDLQAFAKFWLKRTRGNYQTTANANQPLMD